MDADIRWILKWLTVFDAFLLVVFVIILVANLDLKNITTDSSSLETTLNYVQVGTDNKGESELQDLASVNNDIGFEVLKSTVMQDDYQVTVDDSIIALFTKKLVGTYKISDRMTYSFNSDGSFDGFFDSNNMQVTGYSWQIRIIDDVAVVYVISNNNTMVAYALSVNDSGNVVLNYGKGNVYIELDKGGRDESGE